MKLHFWGWECKQRKTEPTQQSPHLEDEKEDRRESTVKVKHVIDFSSENEKF